MKRLPVCVVTVVATAMIVSGAPASTSSPAPPSKAIVIKHAESLGRIDGFYGP